jgi:tetratricopeptide (TPR) repeat protein
MIQLLQSTGLLSVIISTLLLKKMNLDILAFYFYKIIKINKFMDQITNLLNEISAAKKELQEIENYHSTLFDQTAENRARNQTIMWWVLQLAYFCENNQDYQAFFGEGDYEKKLEKYDEIEEKDESFNKEALAKLAYFISLWYMGKANNMEDFKNLETLFSENESSEVKTSKEEVKSE